MSRKCDEQLEQLEDKLTALYANASNEISSKYNDWSKKFEKKDKEMRKQVDYAIISEDDYINWRKKAILQDKKYAETVKSMTDILVNTDIAAMATVNGSLPSVIAQSYNFVQSLGYAAADKAGLSVGTFQIYNAKTVQSLIKKNPNILKHVNKKEDFSWNKDRINRVITQGIVQGKNIPDIAKGLREVSNMDENGAIRNARTAMTGAENYGRNESFQDLQDKGIPVKLQWSATHDNKTRETHILLDGTFQDEDGYFGVGIIDTPLQYPGDPAGDAGEIYNCRCRASIRLEGVDHSQDGDLYEKFMKENYPDDWANIKDDREMKELQFKNNMKGK